MFTGIIEATGSVAAMVEKGGEWHVSFDTGKLDLSDVSVGDSIAVSGVCLTVISVRSGGFDADVSNETRRVTTLGTLQKRDCVNLEKSLRASDRIGGHIVSGHVDGVGRLKTLESESQSLRMTFEVPETLCRYIAVKGSVCIDGVSLTVNQVEADTFSVNIIAHTQQETTIGNYHEGTAVNIEVDLISRYLERLISEQPADARP
ncbi:MAG: riboflavin synthase [Pseudohongiellaceae bacterium]